MHVCIDVRVSERKGSPPNTKFVINRRNLFSFQPLNMFFNSNALSTLFSLSMLHRFSPTRAPAPWDGIRISDKYSPVCPQRLPNIQNETAALEKMPKGRLEYLKRLLPYLENQSEDCLYLNIFSPNNGKSPPVRSGMSGLAKWLCDCWMANVSGKTVLCTKNFLKYVV